MMSCNLSTRTSVISSRMRQAQRGMWMLGRLFITTGIDAEVCQWIVCSKADVLAVSLCWFDWLALAGAESRESLAHP